MKLFTAKDGLTIAADTWGSDTNQPVLFLHGGGQNRNSWGDAARIIALHGFYTVAVDLRGHGESGYASDGKYGIDGFADDIESVIAGFQAPPVLVGASLGGIIAIIAAGERAIPVTGIVLVDVAFRAAAEGADRILAFMRKYMNGFESLEKAAAAIADYLPHRERAVEKYGQSEDLKKYLRKKNDGRYYWHWDPHLLDSFKIEEFMDTRRFIGAARSIKVPVLLLRGMLSDVVTEEIAKELLEAVPHAKRMDIPGAAHTVPGDSNGIFTDSILKFLKNEC